MIAKDQVLGNSMFADAESLSVSTLQIDTDLVETLDSSMDVLAGLEVVVKPGANTQASEPCKVA